MWDRAWIRDAVVATTVRVGVRTLARLLKTLSKFTQHGEPETQSIGTTKLLRLIP
jgi:hypothetical protein